MPETAWSMVCIGPGPGPKNVLAQHVDGRRTVVPYAIWKHKLSKELVQEPFRGHTDLAAHTIDWGGYRAVYSLAERDLVTGLLPREALVVHALKALFDGELVSPEDPSLADDIDYGAPLAPDTEKGPAPAPKRRNEPLPGQTAIAA